MFLVCLVLNEVFFSLYIATLQTQPTRPYIIVGGFFKKVLSLTKAEVLNVFVDAAWIVYLTRLELIWEGLKVELVNYTATRFY